MKVIWIFFAVCGLATSIQGIILPPPNPINPCSLSKQPGKCKAYMPSWYFDIFTQTCKKFIYGGCGGNANRFPTQEACQKRCRCKSAANCLNICARTLCTADSKCEVVNCGGCSAICRKIDIGFPPINPCSLPKQPGPCKGSLLRWYFDVQSTTCKTFSYGGCGGNKNNYKTQADCMNRCRCKSTKGCDNVCARTLCPSNTICKNINCGGCSAVCQKKQCPTCLVNPCQFCNKDQTCVSKTGCLCDSKCVQKDFPPFCPRCLIDPCSLCKKNEKCETKTRCHCDSKCYPKIPLCLEDKCRFTKCSRGFKCEMDKFACKARCVPNGICIVCAADLCSTRECKPGHKCVQSKCGCSAKCVPCPQCILNPCQFCKKGEKCVSKTGCLCDSRCVKKSPPTCPDNCKHVRCKCGHSCSMDLRTCKTRCIKDPPPVDACSQPKTIGPCRANFKRWHFDQKTMQCKVFFWGGCKPNENNFPTKRDCVKRCGALPINPCHQPLKNGPCEASIPRWYFNRHTKRCLPFKWGGCRPNGNNFLTKVSCQKKCGRVDVCDRPKKIGPCKARKPRWFFHNGKCTPFYWGGCQSNGNNFPTKHACMKRCHRYY